MQLDYSQNLWHKIHEEVLELILARLPLLDLVSAVKVCKRWRAAVQSSHFLHASLRQQWPWLFVTALNLLLPCKNLSWTLDPQTCTWLCLGMPPAQASDYTSSAADGLMYFSRHGQEDEVYLLYRDNGLPGSPWSQSPAIKPRRQPLIVASLVHIAVVGGMQEECSDEDTLAAEMLTPGSAAWQKYSSLPVELRSHSCSHWLSGAICQGRLFLYQNAEQLLTSLHLHTPLASWTPVQTLHAGPGTFLFSKLFGCGDRLMLAALCSDVPDGTSSFLVWEMNQTSLQRAGLVTEMPSQLLRQVLGDDDPTTGVQLLTSAVGNIFYVFRSILRGLPLAMCHFPPTSSASPVWSVLPPWPLPPTTRIDIVVPFCANVGLAHLIARSS